MGSHICYQCQVTNNRRVLIAIAVVVALIALFWLYLWWGSHYV